MVSIFSKRWRAVQGPATDKAEVGELEIKSSPEPVDLVKRSWWRWRQQRFSSIGWGNAVLMTLIFVLSSAWSLLLIILNLEPSKSANYILQTESLDNGHFWQSHKAASSILTTSTSLLLVVISVYLYLLYLLLFRSPSRRVHSKELKPKAQNQVWKKPTVGKMAEQQQKVMRYPIPSLVRQVIQLIIRSYRSIVSTDGKHHNVWNVVMEIPEVILQVLSLQEHMAQGLDTSLLYCYASLMALNAFVAFYHIQFRWNEATLHHILKDSTVDAAFAVFFPALILLYSLFIFQDDLTAVKIRQQFFPPRVFERKARNYVSAKELNMFSTDFESLLIRSGWDIFLKLSFSLLACYRWSKIMHLFLMREPKNPSPSCRVARDSSTAPKPLKNCKAVAPLGEENDSSVKNPKTWQHFVRFRLRTLIGIFFLVYGVGCIVYTVIAVQKSQTACSSYPECVQFAYVWSPGAIQDSCACIAYVDRDLAPAVSDNLADITETLTKLADGGKLQTVQLVNRKINGSLPDALQKCQNLRNLVLIHTGVEVFPSWTSESFSKLEYLHIEGDSVDLNLVELPSNLFSKMTHLHTIHLSYHANLLSLPSLVGLTALQSLYFGFLDCIKDFPSVESLPDVQVVALESLPLVRSLPEIAPYESTLEMVFVQNIPVCCSGFLSEGSCNTSYPSCCGLSNTVSTADSTENSQDASKGENTSVGQGSSTGDSTIVNMETNGDGSQRGSQPPTCLVIPDESSFLPTNATLSVLNQFATNASNFCDVAQATCSDQVMLMKLIEEDTCKGVLYRECSSKSQGVGICFNENMGRVQCTHSQATIDMRVAEIAAGCDCDKAEEKWLGCS